MVTSYKVLNSRYINWESCHGSSQLLITSDLACSRCSEKVVKENRKAKRRFYCWIWYLPTGNNKLKYLIDKHPYNFHNQ